MSPLILNKGLHFCYNPFGGIADSELPQVIVPHSFTEAIHRLIQKPATTQIGDARIYWQLVAKVDTRLKQNVTLIFSWLNYQ